MRKKFGTVRGFVGQQNRDLLPRYAGGSNAVSAVLCHCATHARAIVCGEFECGAKENPIIPAVASREGAGRGRIAFTEGGSACTRPESWEENLFLSRGGSSTTSAVWSYRFPLYGMPAHIAERTGDRRGISRIRFPPYRSGEEAKETSLTVGRLRRAKPGRGRLSFCAGQRRSRSRFIRYGNLRQTDGEGSALAFFRTLHVDAALVVLFDDAFGQAQA